MALDLRIDVSDPTVVELPTYIPDTFRIKLTTSYELRTTDPPDTSAQDV